MSLFMLVSVNKECSLITGSHVKYLIGSSVLDTTGICGILSFKELFDTLSDQDVLPKNKNKNKNPNSAAFQISPSS